MNSNNQTTNRFFRWLKFSLWYTLAAAAGYLGWRTIVYWYRLLRQPFLVPLTIALDKEEHQTVEAQGLAIATANLQAGIEPRRLPDGQEKLVLCAGSRNFREPWARDFGFASFGLLELDQAEVTKEGLEVFLINQRPSGQFPVKVHSTNILDRYLHSLFKREQPILFPIRPKYLTGHRTVSLDGNCLLVVAALNYVRQSGDSDFIKSYWPALKRAVTWLEAHAPAPDGLLHQRPFADWADSIGRDGRVLYTNVLYWKALADMAQAAVDFGTVDDQTVFTTKAEQIKTSINHNFWRDSLGYYVNSDTFDNLTSGGNLLAVAWDLAEPAQAHSILDKMNEFGMASPVPTRVSNRHYPNNVVALENRLAGIGNYHSSAAWLWLGAWHVVALCRMQRLQEAEALLFDISKVIVRDGTVHEVYDTNGFPLSTFWYTSEAPLTWSAGLVVYAHHVYRRAQTS